MTTWIFLRHGESTANAARVFSGHEDVELTARGEAQARAAGTALRSVLVNASQLVALSSDLKRAYDTTALALDAAGLALPVQTYPQLRERNLGDWQGQDIDTLKRMGARDVLLRWDGRPPGNGESLKDLARRILPCLAEHDDGRTVLVGSHGGVVRTVVGLADGMPLPELCRWNVPNCEPQVRQYPTGIFSTLLQRIDSLQGEA